MLYEELTPKDFLARLKEAPIAYLPLGTLEWHGAHLPLGSDGLQSRGFFTELAKKVGGIVLPMLFVGPDRSREADGKTLYGMDFSIYDRYPQQQLPGSAYWIEEEVFSQLLESILARLKRAGFQIVVGHGHGPSTKLLQNHIADWGEKFGLKLFVCWRDDEKDGMGIQTDHAAANETSLVMALRPELVQMENLPTDLSEWPLGTGGEDPRVHASSEKGLKIIGMQVERMAGILREALRSS